MPYNPIRHFRSKNIFVLCEKEKLPFNVSTPHVYNIELEMTKSILFKYFRQMSPETLKL